MFRLALLLMAAALSLRGDDALNVNSRYLVERVEFRSKHADKLSDEVRREADALVGKPYDPEAAAEIAKRVRRELNAAEVTHRIEKGEKPEHVLLYFEVRRRRFQQDADITRLAYHSKYGVTGGFNAPIDYKELRFGFGVLSDGDAFVERMAGLNVNAARTIGDRVRIRFDHDRYRAIWNRTTRIAEGEDAVREAEDLYRFRQSFRPTVSVQLARGVVYTAGVDMQLIEFQYPAAREEASNSVIQTLRLRRSWGTSSGPRHDVDAGYSLRAATRTLDSDFVYSRHLADGKYTAHMGDNHVTVRAGGGRIGGEAPLFERFVAGNTDILRGWNKYDLEPLGASRLVFASVEYRYDNFIVFYDTGTVWDRGEARVLRHGAGAGFGSHDWFIAVAFPLRSSGVQPVFMIGTNF